MENDPDDPVKSIKEVEGAWSLEETLGQKGYFKLNAVCQKISPTGSATQKIRKKRTALKKQGLTDRAIMSLMGIFMPGGVLYVDMKKFSQWFRLSPDFNLQKVPETVKELYQMTGYFEVIEICNLLSNGVNKGPFSYSKVTRLINMAIKDGQDPEKLYGAWKEPSLGYVAKMPEFGQWVKSQVP